MLAFGVRSSSSAGINKHLSLSGEEASMLNSQTAARNDARNRPHDDCSERFPRTTSGRRGLRSVEQQIVRGVVDYVEDNFTTSISLRHVAHALGYSPAHLTHRFSLLTGMPVTAWIIRRRLRAAQALLLETQSDIVDVCEAVGFGDICYFTRQFVRHVGLTPSQYRSVNTDNMGMKFGISL
jgi:transcriptional regulator GlxA family with amidase domain